MIRIVNKDTIAREKAAANAVERFSIHEGDAEFNKNQNSSSPILQRDVVIKSAEWEGTEGRANLWDEIERIKANIKKTSRRANAEQAPSQADIDNLFAKFFVDITRQRMAGGDLTSEIATEVTNLDFPVDLNIRMLDEYRGKFETIKGTNDSVPLIEQAQGTPDLVSMDIKALGWKSSLANEIYNPMFESQKVTRAVANADLDYRNSATVGAIVGATYAASQKQAADATSGATYDVLMYNTFRKAIKKLRGLKDYRTDQKIRVPRISILCNSFDTWSIERIIRGQLTTGGANGSVATFNAQALPIANIIEYDYGVTDGLVWGKETLSFPGVEQGKCYVFVPREYFWVMNKRTLTQEQGMGSVLQLSRQEQAWYRIQTEFSKVFFGSSYPGTALGAGYGAIIEVTLPTDS